MTHPVAPDFLALPRDVLADAALSTAKSLGASHADFRLERLRQQGIRLRDGRVEASGESAELGFAVRVVVDGTWGFAAGVDLTPEAAAEVARQAVAVARTCRPVNTEPVELAPEPSHGTATWVSAYEIDPFTDPGGREDRAARRLEQPGAEAQGGRRTSTRACSRYWRTSSTPISPAPSPPSSGYGSSRMSTPPRSTRPGAASRPWTPSPRPPAAAGSTRQGTGWDWDAELAALPDLLAEKLTAPVGGGRATYDLVIDPTNLWLTIHESIGHATELDRALGYEAAYAGTSFATPDKLNKLQYGSGLMNVTGDRTVTHGLATIGYDDEGVATQSWDIVKDGILVGYQLDRRIAAAHRADPLQRLRVRRLPRAHPDPADGQRLPADRHLTARQPRSWSAAWTTGSTSSATSAGRSTCSATTSSSPGSASSRIARREDRRPSARRRLPVHDHRLLGLDERGRRSADLPARRGVQLRQGPTRPGRARSATAARRRCSTACESSTRSARGARRE